MNKLSAKEMLILEILSDNGREMYGLDIIERSDGKLRRGTVYVWLSRLENSAYVASREETYAEQHYAESLRRRLYRITEDGNRALIPRPKPAHVEPATAKNIVRRTYVDDSARRICESSK